MTVVKVMYTLIQKEMDILCGRLSKVKLAFFFHPSIQCFYDWILCWSVLSRHEPKYVINAS